MYRDGVALAIVRRAQNWEILYSTLDSRSMEGCVQSPPGGAGGVSPVAGQARRSAEVIAWEKLVKAAVANGGHQPDEHGDYRCRYPGCNRVFKLPAALHTHTGWHKRKENISDGVYDRVAHHTKVGPAHICCRAGMAVVTCVVVSRRFTASQTHRARSRYLQCIDVTGLVAASCSRPVVLCTHTRYALIGPYLSSP